MFEEVLERLGIQPVNSGVYAGGWVERPGGEEFVSLNPATGQPLARVIGANTTSYEQAVASSSSAFKSWQLVPPPQRGEIVRQIGNALREAKSDLGMLVTLEAGKIKSEGLGEVQEMIDMCDFAVGVSRQLYGLTIASERPDQPCASPRRRASPRRSAASRRWKRCSPASRRTERRPVS